MKRFKDLSSELATQYFLEFSNYYESSRISKVLQSYLAEENI